MQNKKGFFALLFNGVLLGTYGIWVRLLQHTFSGYQQVTLRSIVSFFFAVILALFLRKNWHFDKKHNKHLFLYLFFFAISTILFTLSAIATSIALSVFGLYSGSIVTAFVLGALFFHEKITPDKLVSVLLVFIALLLFTYPFSLHLFNIGLLIGFCSGVFDSIGNAFKKYFKGKIEVPVLIVLQFFATLLVALSLTAFSHEAFSTIQFSLPITTTVLLYGGIFLAVGYLSLYGFQNFNLNLGTIVISSELFWAPLFALLIFHETLTTSQILGGVLIATAIVVPYLKIYNFIF